jgi:hypothetical protein
MGTTAASKRTSGLQTRSINVVASLPRFPAALLETHLQARPQSKRTNLGKGHPV